MGACKNLVMARIIGAIVLAVLLGTAASCSGSSGGAATTTTSATTVPVEHDDHDGAGDHDEAADHDDGGRNDDDVVGRATGRRGSAGGVCGSRCGVLRLLAGSPEL